MLSSNNMRLNGADYLKKDEKLENRVKMICSFNNLKCKFDQGRINNLTGTNLCFIEPHTIDIEFKPHKKISLIYFTDKSNLFMYNRQHPIDINNLDSILKELKKEFN